MPVPPSALKREPADQSVTIMLTQHEFDLLMWLIHKAELESIGKLFESFAGDLASSWRNGGSDERAQAFDYFKRRYGHALDTDAYDHSEAVHWYNDAGDS